MYSSWAKHFQPVGRLEILVKVPLEWENFLTLKLLDKDRFQWVKEVMLSDIWKVLTSSNTDDSLMFTLPQQCPVETSHRCRATTTEMEVECTLPLQPEQSEDDAALTENVEFNQIGASTPVKLPAAEQH